MVVAETLAVAKDAAELVEIDYEPLPAVTDTRGGGRRPARRGSTIDVAQRLHRRRCRRRRGDRGGVRARRARGEARHLGAARHRRADGAARRGRRLRHGDRQATPCTPAPAAWCGRRRELRRHPRRADRTTCGSMRATSAAISAPATRSSRSSRWWCGRRSALGRPVKWTCERSEAFAQRLPGPRPGRSRSSLRSTPRANSWRCAARSSSNIGAHTRASFVPLVKGSRAADHRSIACRPRISAPARC